jgi:putative Mn2+ efflux pump MntP
MYIPIMVTIFLVSLDALFVGMSLKLQKSFRASYNFIIAGIIFALCVPAYFIAGGLMEHIDFDMDWIVGAAFLILGFRNLFAKDEEQMVLSIGAIIALGLVMSIDGVVATAALTIEQGKIFAIPILTALGHLAFLFIGCFAAKIIRTSHKVHNIISASCLFLVAALNFFDII